MAQAPRSSDSNDSFIRHIVTDPKNVPDVMLLTGYLGPSSEEAHERLYLSADLTNYVEIPNSAILHQAPLPKEQDAHGGVTLWVRKDAALQYKMAPAAQALANYFAGAIQAGAQGAPGGAGAAVGPRATIGVHCATFNCSLHCPTEITPCINTHANTCFCPVTHGCPTQNQLCQSQGACTFIGCGHTLACTFGLLCAGIGGAAAGAAPQLAQAAQATAACLPQTPFCPTRINCPPPTLHATCAHICTRVTPCLPTRFQPQCPFPTEICTHVGCQTLHGTCNFACQNTNPAICQIASGFVCPQVSLACPQQSLACGGFPGQGGFGGQVEQARFFSMPVACQTRPEFCNTRFDPECHPM